MPRWKLVAAFRALLDLEFERLFESKGDPANRTQTLLRDQKQLFAKNARRAAHNSSRDNKTAIELFIAGIRGGEVRLQQILFRRSNADFRGALIRDIVVTPFS
jgi:hypothetical protein